MKCKTGIVCMWMSACIACSDQLKQQPVAKAPKATVDTIRAKPPSHYQDTLVIKGASAVFYYPDSLQDQTIKMITDSAIYTSSVHEMFYQMRNSKIVLQKYYPSLKIVEAKKIRYLFFEREEGHSQYIDLNTKNDARGMFIFDGKQAPRLVDMTNIETELGFYFKK